MFGMVGMATDRDCPTGRLECVCKHFQFKTRVSIFVKSTVDIRSCAADSLLRDKKNCHIW